MTEHSDEAQNETSAPERGSRWANAFYVLMSPFVLAFTGYNFWRLAADGEIYIRNQGRFVPPDYSLYFWTTLLLYVVLFVASVSVLLLFLAWAVGRIKAFWRRDETSR